jgi:hypothetical protein
MADRFAMVTTPVDFGYEGINLIEVSLFYGTQHYDVLLNGDVRRTDVSFVAEEKAGREIRYSYRAYMRSGPFAQGAQTSFASTEGTADGTLITVDPRELYRIVQLGASAVFSAEKYAAAFVDFKVEMEGDGFARTFTIELTPTQVRDFRELVPVPLHAKCDVQHRVRHVLRQGTVLEGPWQGSDTGVILVGEPEVVGV